jgi:raffinose/stachyose/melibiose transport system permease protein
MPYLLMLPAVAIYGVFLLLPFARMVVMSFWRWNGFTPGIDWVGIANYQQLYHDSSFWIALLHNLEWVAWAIVPIAAGLGLAVLLSQPVLRGRSVYRSVFFLPYVMPTVVTALVWSWIYEPTWGSLNSILKDLGLASFAQDWLGNPHVALPSLAAAANWTGYGFCMMLFLGGLASIDESVYDAAKVDGAGAWKRFTNVTLPGLRNTTNIVVLIVFINTMKVFDIVNVLTGGGPANATQVMGMDIYNATFSNQTVGYGAAMAVVTSVIIIVPSVGYLKLREARG